METRIHPILRLRTWLTLMVAAGVAVLLLNWGYERERTTIEPGRSDSPATSRQGVGPVSRPPRARGSRSTIHSAPNEQGPGDLRQELAEIRVRVHCDDVEGILSDGVVEARPRLSREVVAASSLNEHGEALFWLPAGEYAFMAIEESLPAGLLPPPLQRRPSHSYRSGDHAPTVLVDAGDTVTVEIPLHIAARIHGRVTYDSGDPIEGIVVSAASVHVDDLRFAHVGETDASGAYEISVRAGSYRVCVQPVEPQHEVYGRTRPRPKDASVRAGEDALLDFPFGRGSADLAGTVVDPPSAAGESELRWENVLVIVMPWNSGGSLNGEVAPYNLGDRVAQTRTDEQGAYSFEGLEPGSYKLHFSPYDGFTPSDVDCRFGAWAPSLVVEVDAGEFVDAGAWWIPRARPCEVIGSVTDESGAPLSSAKVEVKYSVDVDGDRTYTKSVFPDASGTFSIDIHTNPSGMPAIVRVRDGRSRETTVERSFQPVPNGTVSLDLVVR